MEGVPVEDVLGVQHGELAYGGRGVERDDGFVEDEVERGEGADCGVDDDTPAPCASSS